MFKVFFRPFYYSLRSGSSYCFVGCLSIWFHCEFRKPGFVSLFWMEGLCSCPFPSVCISSTCVVPSTWSFAATACLVQLQSHNWLASPGLSAPLPTHGTTRDQRSVSLEFCAQTLALRLGLAQSNPQGSTSTPADPSLGP
jgi:hypothetical protein